MKKLAIVWLSIIIILFSFSKSAKADNEKKIRGISIEKAIKIGIVSATVVGLGGHGENCISITIKNLTGTDTMIRIESGRRLDTYDSGKQDILIVRERLIALAGREEKKLNLYGFCCEATKGSPKTGEKFSIGQMADSALIKIANFLFNNLVSAVVAQQAIWVMSNNHSLASVTGNEDEVKKVKKYLSKLKNIEIPWYDISYAKPDSGQAFSNRAVMVSGEIAFHISTQTIGRMVVLNERGQMVDAVFGSKPLMPDYYVIPVDLDVRFYSKGTYTIKLFTNGEKLMLERQFKI